MNQKGQMLAQRYQEDPYKVSSPAKSRSSCWQNQNGLTTGDDDDIQASADQVGPVTMRIQALVRVDSGYMLIVAPMTFHGPAGRAAP